MTDDAAPAGGKRAKAEADRAERLAREAAALRENLRRRKAQGRAREEAVTPTRDGADKPGA